MGEDKAKPAHVSPHEVPKGEGADALSDLQGRIGLDALRLLHELQVHQVELQSQNEELTAARSAAEAAMQLYAELYDEAPVGYLTIARDGTIRRANPCARALLTETGRDVVGVRLRSLVVRSDRSALDGYLGAVQTGGSPEDCEVSLEGSREAGPLYALVRGNYSKLRDEWRLSLVDVTKRRRAEEELSQREEELRQSQKMEAVGQLAGGIAHDFNNLLTAIIGYTDLILETPEGRGPLLTPDLREIRAAAERAAALTRQILAFARKQALRPEEVAVNELVVALASLLRRTLGEDVELNLRLSPGLGVCEIDPNQFCQILLNLALNSRDAMPGGGTLTIETAVADSRAPFFEEIPAREGVMVAVTDTGCGMGPETVSHIFEPFFTTKEQGKGTGLGLSTVYGIVRQSGGSILVESEPRKGTTFRMFFPAVGGVSSVTDAKPATDEWASAEQTPESDEP